MPKTLSKTRMVEGHLSLSLAPPGGESAMDMDDWRTQLQPDSRHRIVNKILETLKRHLPYSGEEGLIELKKIAVRFEEKIYAAATSQSDYLRKISLKMLTMETKSQSTITNSLPFESAHSSNAPPDFASLDSTAQMGHANEDDWQEEVHQKINDWRTVLQPASRQRIVNKIMETLKRHIPYSGEEGLIELKKIAVAFEETIYAAAPSQLDYLRKISVKMLTMETKSQSTIPNSLPFVSADSSNAPPDFASLDSTAQMGHANEDDWKEEVYQKIKAMKEMYLPELNEMYQRLQQLCCLPQQPKSEQLEKLMVFKTMLERIITFLQVSKENVLPGFREKLDSYEKQIINFINTNRPRQAVPTLQQGPLPPSQKHSMQHPQSQITQLQSHENQMSPLMQSMILQQHMKQQEEQQLSQTQKIEQLQQLQLQQDLFRRQLMLQQQQQWLHQQAKQHLPEQLQSHQMPQLHQINDVNDLNMGLHLLSLNNWNNIASADVQSFGGLPSDLFPAQGISRTPMSNTIGQNSNMQNRSSISQNSVVNSMGQGVPSNIFASSPWLMHGMQENPHQQPPQHFQNPQEFLFQQQMLHQQQLQKALPKHKFEQSLIQSHVQQQQQKQNLSQPTKLQQSGMQTPSVMQPFVMQSAPLTTPQQQPQQADGIHQLQLIMPPQHSMLMPHQPKNPLKQMFLIRTERAHHPETSSSIVLHLCGCLVLFLLCVWLYVLHL